MKPSCGGTVAGVESGGLADMAGVRAGDRVLSINGHALRDVIDYQFYGADEELTIVVQRAAGQRLTLHIERDYSADLGIEFTDLTFDGIRRCRNRCEFCFVQQMPPGLRKSLYVRDDDYRYSFLFGNFVTLTNLGEEDWERIAEQGLSPLYISVHATDPQLRERILGTPERADVLPAIRRLGKMGVDVHAQIVVIPGVNDGAALEQTVRDLAALYPTVRSIALVPLGLTRYHTCGLRTLTPPEAEGILDFIQPLQRGYRRDLGVSLVYASDELYLMAGQAVPSARAYSGFPQRANGVGLTRQLIDDWRQAKRHGRQAPWPYGKVTLACGTLIASTLQALSCELADFMNAEIEVVAVPNRFFGPTVTVSGLLVAGDVLEALQGRQLGDLVVLPRAMFDARGDVTLDDRTRCEIEEQLGVRMTVADGLGEVLRL